MLRRLTLFAPRLAAATIAFVAALPAVADIERGKQIATGRCFLCHGISGESASELYPRLASQHASYVARQLRDFQSGRRKGTAMNDMAKGLTEAEMLALGAYYQQQKAEPHPPGDAALVSAGKALYAEGNAKAGLLSCASCHGAGAEGTETLPRLAGQVADYTAAQLRQFNKRERTNDNEVMHVVASRLGESDIKALAEYLATLP